MCEDCLFGVKFVKKKHKKWGLGDILNNLINSGKEQAFLDTFWVSPAYYVNYKKKTLRWKNSVKADPTNL